MQIDDMTREASQEFLVSHRFGRLACVKDLQPYITPFSYRHHGGHLYSFGTVGQKVDWLRANPLACVEVDHVTSAQEWTSVIALARYEELTDTNEGAAARDFAHGLLADDPFWWEPGYAKTVIAGAARPMEPVYFRLAIGEITGRRASP
jgi:uncharacterized protein